MCSIAGERRGHWLADEPELGQANSLEPDLVTDEMDGRGADCGRQLGPDGHQRGAHDGESRRIRVAASANELRRDATRVQLCSDLLSGAVYDHDVLPGRVALQDDADSIARNAPAELDHDTDGH